MIWGATPNPPLYKAGILNPLGAHYIEDPPRVVGLEGVLDASALGQGECEGGVPATVRHCHGPVLVRWNWCHNAPVEPGGFTTAGASMKISLSG